jgi:hypothetical protein
MKYLTILLALGLSSCLPFGVNVTLGGGQSTDGEVVVDYSAKGVVIGLPPTVPINLSSNK